MTRGVSDERRSGWREDAEHGARMKTIGFIGLGAMGRPMAGTS